MSVLYEKRESAYHSRIQTYAIVNAEHINLDAFLDDGFAIFAEKQLEIISKQHMIKTYSVFCAEFKKTVITADSTAEIRQDLYILSRTHIIDIDTDFREWYTEFIASNIKKRVESFEISESGWTLAVIKELAIFNNRYESIRGSSYIKLPANIERKGAVLNIKNTLDNKCFMWSVLAKLHPIKGHACRVTKYYQFQHELNFTGISFPVKLTSIKRFEALNSTISVNVYAYDSEAEKKFVPVRLTKEIKETHVNLLLVHASHENTGESVSNILSDVTVKSHYALILNLSRLLSAQCTKSKAGKMHICDRCLHYFYSESKLKRHYENCLRQNHCAISMPSEETKIIKFKNHQYKLKIPFCIYADIEAILKPVTKSTFSNIAYQEHEAFSVAFYFKSEHNDTISFF